MHLDDRHYGSDAAVRGFYDRLTADLRGRPRVVTAAAGSFVPFTHSGDGTEFFIEGRRRPGAEGHSGGDPESDHARIRRTLARFASSRGRHLNAGDSRDAMKAAMISETLAKRHFGGSDPVGQRLRLGRSSPESLDDRRGGRRREELRDRRYGRAADLRAVCAAAIPRR